MSKKPNAPAKQQPRGQQQQRQIQVEQQSWHGPLPPPSELQHFDDIVPGAAERIIRMAELEGEHSRRIQAIAVRAAARGQLLGQVFALTIAAGGLVAAVWLALAGHDTVAVTVAGTTITTVVVAFLQARKASKSQN